MCSFFYFSYMRKMYADVDRLGQSELDTFV